MSRKISVCRVTHKTEIFCFNYICVCALSPQGFEPTPPKRTELESVALDHSATDALIIYITVIFSYVHRASQQRDSNSRPSRYEGDALTTLLYINIIVYKQVVFM